ncbi:MAG: hypothetical protein V1743_07475 [Nanoarchaeota archaeon]
MNLTQMLTYYMVTSPSERENMKILHGKKGYTYPQFVVDITYRNAEHKHKNIFTAHTEARKELDQYKADEMDCYSQLEREIQSREINYKNVLYNLGMESLALTIEAVFIPLRIASAFGGGLSVSCERLHENKKTAYRKRAAL